MPENGYTTYKYVRPIQPLRPRRPRSKDGCLGCRLRRKKCDEGKPVCGACSKLGLLCSWPSVPGSANKGHEFQWRLKLKAGKSVSHCAATPPVETLPPSKAVTCQRDLPGPSRRWQFPPGPVRSMSDKHFDHPFCSILLEHYIGKTADLLAGRDAARNAFLWEVLPIANSNELVMYALLAVSGVHMENGDMQPSVSKATYTFYGNVLKQLKLALTEWVAGSRSETLILFLVATLMCMFEALRGNIDGSMSYHLRACREFAVEIATGSQKGSSCELSDLLVECYAYFSLIAHFDDHNPAEKYCMWDGEAHIASAIERMQASSTFGSYFGCAFELYRLIPDVSSLLLHEDDRLSPELSSNRRKLLGELTRKVMRWRVSSEDTGTPEASVYESTSESTSGIVIQNTLLILLHSCRHDQYWDRQTAWDMIQPLIDYNMSLFDVLEDTPAMSVTFWTFFITASMLRDRRQQEAFVKRLTSHHTKTALTDRIIQLLKWVWEDSNESTYGLVGLSRVARVHGTHLCLV